MSENQANSTQNTKQYFFCASAADFKKIPGSPIAYWANRQLLQRFESLNNLTSVASPKKGLVTSDNNRFLRKWYEVSFIKVGLNYDSRETANESKRKWFPINAGGAYRKWFGNAELLVNWENDGNEIIGYAADLYGSASRQIQNTIHYFKPCITWSNITTAEFAARIAPSGFIFGAAGTACIPNKIESLYSVLAFLNSKTVNRILKLLNPTLNFVVADVASLPFDEVSASLSSVFINTGKNIFFAKEDWDSYETSWDFTSLPLLQVVSAQSSVSTEEKNSKLQLLTAHYPLATKLSESYAKLRAHWQEMTLEMQRLEEENNRIFIEAYGLQDELTPKVPLSEITLTCNPHYRYSNSKNAKELEALLLADTMKEFISYAVGCMFGRYSLCSPGLILANQGDGLEDYYRIVSSNQLSVISNQEEEEFVTDGCQLTADSFPPDADNVIPILDGDWFPDDITERFRKFLRVTFGEAHYEENLKFIEAALGKDIRKYFLKDFYNDHLRRYKKRPIYWLFSSPKGSFNALIYMHRYRPDTASVVLNGYLREFRIKLLSRKSHLEAVSISASASAGEKTKALKEIESLRKMIEELESYERDVLYPLATEQIAIDLDDGVKVNYQKFGPALKKIPGLDAKEE